MTDNTIPPGKVHHMQMPPFSPSSKDYKAMREPMWEYTWNDDRSWDDHDRPGDRIPAILSTHTELRPKLEKLHGVWKDILRLAEWTGTYLCQEANRAHADLYTHIKANEERIQANHAWLQGRVTELPKELLKDPRIADLWTKVNEQEVAIADIKRRLTRAKL